MVESTDRGKTLVVYMKHGTAILFEAKLEGEMVVSFQPECQPEQVLDILSKSDVGALAAFFERWMLELDD